MDRPRVAFISGHTDLSQAEFDRIYTPLIDDAVTTGHAFILGDAVGVDTMALAYLLSNDDLVSQVTVYASRKYNIPKLKALGVKVIGPDDTNFTPTPEIEALIGVENEGRNKARYRHLIRDTHMTLNSDYDILYVRTEEESRGMYGARYMPRTSATKYNQLRREQVRAREQIGAAFAYGRAVRQACEKWCLRRKILFCVCGSSPCSFCFLPSQHVHRCS